MKKKQKGFIRRKDRKHINKLILLYKDTFEENINYSVELHRKITFARFIKKYKTLICVILFLPILLITYFFFISRNLYYATNEAQIYSVTMFDLVATCITYFGTAFFALIVFYNSWKQDRRKENENAIRVHTEIGFNSDGCSLFSEDDFKTWRVTCSGGNPEDKVKSVKVNLTNQNNTTPIRVAFKGAYRLENNKTTIVKENYRSYTSADEAKLLDFNETEVFYIGFNENIFEKRVQLYLLFYITNAYDEKVYCVIDCPIEDGFCEECLKSGTLIAYDKFNELKEKYNFDFLKEVVWSSPIGWKKKWMNRVYLYK